DSSPVPLDDLLGQRAPESPAADLARLGGADAEELRADLRLLRRRDAAALVRDRDAYASAGGRRPDGDATALGRLTDGLRARIGSRRRKRVSASYSRSTSSSAKPRMLAKGVRSSWDTVATSSFFNCSASRSAVTSRATIRRASGCSPSR